MPEVLFMTTFFFMHSFFIFLITDALPNTNWLCILGNQVSFLFALFIFYFLLQYLYQTKSIKFSPAHRRKKRGKKKKILLRNSLFSHRGIYNQSLRSSCCAAFWKYASSLTYIFDSAFYQCQMRWASLLQLCIPSLASLYNDRRLELLFRFLFLLQKKENYFKKIFSLKMF